MTHLEAMPRISIEYLCVYCLFNDTASSLDFVAWNGRWSTKQWQENNEEESSRGLI
jgi:hypothetical protein